MLFPSLLLLILRICLTSGLLESDVHNVMADNNDNVFRFEETLNNNDFDEDFANLLKNDDAVSFHPLDELSLFNLNASLEAVPQQQPLKTNKIRLALRCPRFDM